MPGSDDLERPAAIRSHELLTLSLLILSALQDLTASHDDKNHRYLYLQHTQVLDDQTYHKFPKIPADPIRHHHHKYLIDG